MMAIEKDSALRMLGLATRAGKTVTGAQGCGKAVVRGKARLVLIASDAAEDTSERMTRLCARENIPCRIAGNGDQLGQYTGKDCRMVVGIIDPVFADRIRDLLDKANETKE
ncbi:MAG TPA: L7Ae/L30e/S12e/Gadd45 family ribosomal protein [Clostridia bacterium]